jgi:hypothetical protein
MQFGANRSGGRIGITHDRSPVARTFMRRSYGARGPPVPKSLRMYCLCIGPVLFSTPLSGPLALGFYLRHSLNVGTRKSSVSIEPTMIL